MPENSDDRGVTIFVVAGSAGVLVAAGLVWERYSPKVACVIFFLLQIYLTVYGMALKPAAPVKGWWRGEAFTCAVFLIANALVLPLFLRASFHAFGSNAFNLGSSSDTLVNWALYVINEVTDAILLGIPSMFSIAFVHIEHSGRYGPFIVSYVRLIVVAQFVQVLLNLWRSRKMA
jgi:hypothetical protein